MDFDIFQTNIPVYLIPVISLLVLGAGVALWGGYKTSKKVLGGLSSCVSYCLSRMSFGLMASGVMLAAGISGSGFAIGDLSEQPSAPKQQQQQKPYFTNQELISLVKDSSVDQAKLESILEYADLRQNQEEYINVPIEQPQIVVDGKNILPIQADIAMLGLGIALIISSIVTFFRSVD